MKIKRCDLGKFVKKNYYDYGVEVNEDRAVPSYIDGVKPVIRRALWAAAQLALWPSKPSVKTARLVGDIIGKYHAHGDTAVHGAIATQVHSNVPLFIGEGNWGNFSDKSYAAMRYSNVKLSKFAQEIFFNPFYEKCTQLVDNFDASLKEPVLLNALLPNAILNGQSGIGVGMGTNIPSYTLDSVLAALDVIFTEKAVTKKALNKLVFSHQEGATVNKALETNAEQIKTLNSEGKGRILFEPVMSLIKNNQIVVTGFSHGDYGKAVVKVEKLACVLRTFDGISKTSRKGKMIITLKKSLKGEALDKAVEDVRKALSSYDSFNITAISRELKDGIVKRSIRKLGVQAILEEWYKFRIDLELKACGFAIDRCHKKIADLELKIKAVSFLDFIVSLLKSKLDDSQMSEKLAEKMGVTKEEAFSVLCLEVRQLKALEVKSLQARIKETKTEIKGYNTRIKNPDEYIKGTLKNYKKL